MKIGNRNKFKSLEIVELCEDNDVKWNEVEEDQKKEDRKTKNSLDDAEGFVRKQRRMDAESLHGHMLLASNM